MTGPTGKGRRRSTRSPSRPSMPSSGRDRRNQHVQTISSTVRKWENGSPNTCASTPRNHPPKWLPAIEELSSVAGLCKTFQDATGWKLEIDCSLSSRRDADLTKSAPDNPGDGTAPGLFRIGRLDDVNENAIERDVASRLAGDLASVVGDLAASQDALRHREAELAAGVPVMPRTDEAEHLAERLEAILAGGAESVGCHAAEIYLLDDATSVLKLRAVWGMSQRRLAELCPTSAGRGR